MRSATLFSFFALACLGSLASCGSGADDGNLLIKLSGLPARATALSLSATLNGKAAMSDQQVAAPTNGQVGVILPSGTTGDLILTVQATDSDGCLQASGTVDTPVSGKYTEVPLTLTVQSPRKCGSLPGCAAGSVCSYGSKPGGSSNLWGIWASSPTNIWAVGDNSTALRYDGTTWQSVQIPSPFYYNSVWGTGPKDVWAVGQIGVISHYDGKTWTLSPNNAASDLTGVYGVSTVDVWAVGSYNSTSGQSEFWHWDGIAWRRVVTSITTSLLGVWASSPTDITASGLGGTLIHYNGVTISSIFSNTTNDLRTVWGVNANLVFAGGAMGTLLRNDGTGWKKIVPTGYGSTLYGLAGDATTVYGVGNANSSGNMIKGTAPFDTFNVQGTTGNDLTSVTVSSNGIGWVTGKLGYLGYFDTRP